MISIERMRDAFHAVEKVRGEEQACQALLRLLGHYWDAHRRERYDAYYSPIGTKNKDRADYREHKRRARLARIDKEHAEREARRLQELENPTHINFPTWRQTNGH